MRYAPRTPHAAPLPDVLEEIHAEIQPYLGQGRVADYIPELKSVAPDQFAMAVHTVSGARYQVGAADALFSIQSISKVMSLTLAMTLEGPALWQRIGREPSGTPFNSLVQLEYENGIPRNPFINAGALVVTDVILSHLNDAKDTVLNFVRGLANNPEIGFDLDVARSEAETGHRNAAMAHFLRSFGNLHHPAAEVLDAYFHHCALAMSCNDLAAACLFLANGGRMPLSDVVVTSPSQTKYINALLLTCGTYDAVGDFAYRVGLPGKSGVGGGIVAVMPGQFSVCVWSPGLNESGNSLAGTLALEWLTTKTGISIF